MHHKTRKREDAAYLLLKPESAERWLMNHMCIALLNQGQTHLRWTYNYHLPVNLKRNRSHSGTRVVSLRVLCGGRTRCSLSGGVHGQCGLHSVSVSYSFCGLHVVQRVWLGLFVCCV